MRECSCQIFYNANVVLKSSEKKGVLTKHSLHGEKTALVLLIAVHQW